MPQETINECPVYGEEHLMDWYLDDNMKYGGTLLVFNEYDRDITEEYKFNIGGVYKCTGCGVYFFYGYVDSVYNALGHYFYESDVIQFYNNLDYLQADMAVQVNESDIKYTTDTTVSGYDFPHTGG